MCESKLTLLGRLLSTCAKPSGWGQRITGDSAPQLSSQPKTQTTIEKKSRAFPEVLVQLTNTKFSYTCRADVPDVFVSRQVEEGVHVEAAQTLVIKQVGADTCAIASQPVSIKQ